MSKRHRGVTRRVVLKGLGGACLGLPVLDAFSGHEAHAAQDGGDFAVFLVGCNGVQQRLGRSINGAPGNEPERFWPSNEGSLTQQSLAADAAERTLGVLADHAERLVVVRGIEHPFGSQGCAHNGGDGQVLTAAHPVRGMSFDTADGESIDNLIGTAKNPPGREPLALRAGKFPDDATGFDYPGHVSYRAPNQPRAAEANPLAAYQRMVGIDRPDDLRAPILSARRKSVNDLVRTQMQRLLNLPDLSAADRQRLDQHFTAVRDLEVQLQGPLPADKVAELEAVAPDPLNPANHEQVLKLQLELLAFAISSGYTRSATLKIGDRIDRAIWTLNGVELPEFHMISHRIFGDGGSGDLIEGAAELHHEIDLIHARMVKAFLDQLAAVDTPEGPLLDQGYVGWTNQIAVGSHAYHPIPWVIAGRARGALKTGTFVDVGRVESNRLLNALIGAVGVRKENGDPVDDFGASELSNGILSEILA